MLFVVEIKDKRDTYLLDRLILDGYSAVTADKAYLYAEPKTYLMSIRTILTDDVTNFAPDSVVFSREISEKTAELLKAKNIAFFDYNKDENFLVKNAELTAEGALAHLIMNTNISLENTKTLILGYGRVGKAVAKLLKQNGVYVAVAARRKEARDNALELCNKAYSMDGFLTELSSFTAIVNTVPDKILQGDILEHIDKECFILDLASLPGGVDYPAAKEMGLNIMHALGVPGKIAPESAAKCILESVLTSLNIKK